MSAREAELDQQLTESRSKVEEYRQKLSDIKNHFQAVLDRLPPIEDKLESIKGDGSDTGELVGSTKKDVLAHLVELRNVAAAIPDVPPPAEGVQPKPPERKEEPKREAGPTTGKLPDKQAEPSKKDEPKRR